MNETEQTRVKQNEVEQNNVKKSSRIE